MSEAKVEFEKRFGGMTPDHPCVPDVWMNGFEAGKESRDGLREALEEAQKFVVDQIAEIGACDHSVGHCECDVIRLAENIKKALEADGGVK